MLWQWFPLLRLGLPSPTEPLLAILASIYAVSLVSSTCGLKTRVSTVTAATLGLYLWGLASGSGGSGHGQALPVTLSLVLASSRCGDAISIDAWLRRATAPPKVSYRWPIVAGRFAFAMAEFSSGLNTILSGWLTSDPDPSLQLVQSPWLMTGLVYTALGLELLAPVALLMPGRVRLTIILGLLGMQLWNGFGLGIHSGLPWLAAYAFWVPWNGIGACFPAGLRAVLVSMRDHLRTRLRLSPVHGSRLPVSRASLDIVERSVRLRSGPAQLGCSPTDVIATSIVRNAEETLPAFLKHHRALGVRHFVFLDTGSRDGTLQITQDQDDVTVLETSLPFGTWVHSMRAYVSGRFSTVGWCLQVDADELFDFPFSERVGLEAFVGYLNDRRFDAVLANMLETFSHGPVLETPSGKGLRDRYRFYDLGNIRRQPLPKDYRVTNPALRQYRGGIRRTAFRTRRDMLYKYPLVRFSDLLSSADTRPHLIRGRPRVADVSCVLYHYQFTDTLLTRSREAVQDRNYGSFSEKYRHFLDVLEHQPGLSLRDCAEDPHEMGGTNVLVDQGFLQVSEDYLRWSRSV
jgi:hypothetical protein